MSSIPRLALPGEGLSRVVLWPSATVKGFVIGGSWLLIQSSGLPTLHLTWLPFDPISPLLVAWCLSARKAEALWLAVGLGLLADSLSGAPSGRLVMRYLLLVLFASPAQGHIVLRDRWMPTLGVAILSVVSGFFVCLLPALLGAELSSDLRSIPEEALAASVASLLLWPALLRLTGSAPPRATAYRDRR